MPLYASTPAFVSSSRTGTPIDIGRRVPPSTSALPSRLQPRSLESTPPMQPSPEASPSPASLQRLYGLDASMLVAMILDKRGQDASLLLQQQLKSGGPDKQNEIYDAVRRHLLCLAQDRHGNFLVQRTIEARPQTAWDLSGSFVDLTLSQFGSHVVQKILEGDEKIREQVAEELMGAKLEQTLTSRNSIHVWQRILEAEWRRGEFRERIFASINAQLAGKWAQTARQETGSIICQNIFESAHEDEKRPCMHEVLDELDRCASNQWGVWVVQHIIEHGTDEDRKAALRKLLGSAATLALSPYGQKAIMSGLKTRDPFFVEEFVSALCQSSGARRPPLIDVCLSPHGIQIVTQLLTTVRQEIRDRIISTVRRNSVFLKGSKTGMKVHQLCERARAFAGY
ncbi:ARM repeat-containing protein [Testicularia cyperi]|uniref:ARM repeat-containing protein n=1 Tax=Testicularia cyperi TaxID=1882483 RepID=A0A317XLQ7_9BASI|nr:ARM repeat-containing protein [Testicularia cyperi]